MVPISYRPGKSEFLVQYQSLKPSKQRHVDVLREEFVLQAE